MSAKLASEAFEGFKAFDAAAFKDGAIPLKCEELMAVAVALTTQSPYCIEIAPSDRNDFIYLCRNSTVDVSAT